MQRQGIRTAEAEGFHYRVELVFIDDLEHQLPRRGQTGIGIKIHIKGPLEELGKILGKFPAFRNDADTVRGKAVAVQQNAEAFRQCAAMLLGKSLADLCLDPGRKRCIHL